MRGKAFVITGGFGILGAETARAAARAGGRVAVVDRAPQPPAGLQKDCGSQTVVLGGIDLTDAAAARTAIDTAHQKLGALDVLINIAGTFRWQTVADGDAATWQLLFAINLQTAVNCCRAAIPHLAKSTGGRIVNIGANAALKAGSGMGAYAASKAGVHRLTESLAEELKESGITVNAVLPSIIDTPANRADMPKADFSKWVTPQALAEVILFLASAQAAPITGALLPVTGRI
ncbi:MAG TPA: SDR family NAD(P)-dependent oxidoreductase [Steroidobacteraceae bacterium]|nr:SDR family NAD(P)-dependent oxidoreductase [Steroidobacteraceae bacterium]